MSNVEVDTWFFGATAAVSVVGIILAASSKDPRVTLALVSLPGSVFQFFVISAAFYTMVRGGLKPSIGNHLIAFFAVLFIFNLVYFGLPLISFFVMIGVIIGFAHRRQILTRWTLVTRALLVLTVLSYALSAYVNYKINWP